MTDAPTSTDAPAEQLPPAPAPADGGATAGTVVTPTEAARIDAAIADAVGQHATEKPRRRGKDRGPRQLPPQCRPKMEGLGDVPGAGAVPPGEAVPLQVDWQADSGGPVEPAFDEKAAAALIDVVVRLLNDGAETVVRAVIAKETGNSDFAALEAKAVRMTADIEKAVKTGGLAVCKKYAVQMAYAPELMLGGGLLVWAAGVASTVKGVRAKAKQLREAA